MKSFSLLLVSATTRRPLATHNLPSYQPATCYQLAASGTAADIGQQPPSPLAHPSWVMYCHRHEATGPTACALKPVLHKELLMLAASNIHTSPTTLPAGQLMATCELVATVSCCHFHHCKTNKSLRMLAGACRERWQVPAHAVATRLAPDSPPPQLSSAQLCSVV